MEKEVSCEKEKPKEPCPPRPEQGEEPLTTGGVSKQKRTQKPKSSGNKNFRKLNKMGFYRFMRKKETEKEKNK